MIKQITNILPLILLFHACILNAAKKDLEEVVVVGSMADVSSVPGSGVAIDLEQLERFDYTDLHQILSSVPGVYIREEDGYGLRPNIGIRGAVAERSQKNHYYGRWHPDYSCALFCAGSLLRPQH